MAAAGEGVKSIGNRMQCVFNTIPMKHTIILIGLFMAIVSVNGQIGTTAGQSLKQCMHAGETIKQVRVPTHATREEVLALIREKNPDMLYLDAHHVACTEWDIDRICKAAAEVKMPVLMRIDHADQAGMISSLLDLGLAGIKVPTVEDEETAQKIIDGFYYPPRGKRSLGGAFNWGEKIGLIPEGMPYHEWWNKNGILGIKLETVKGVLLARYLAKPGIDFMDFGGQDLGHDISIRKHPGFETLEDCRKFVEKALRGTDTVF